MLAAFANGADSLLPEPPVTYFPCQPCTPEFFDNGNSLFASLDELATLEGGGTPLYDSLAGDGGYRGSTAPREPAPDGGAVLGRQGIYCAIAGSIPGLHGHGAETVVTLAE